MKKLFDKHNAFWGEKRFLVSVVVGLLLLAGSLYVNSLANSYTTTHASNTVTDILLDNLPTVNVEIVYSDGAMLFLMILVLVLFHEPRRIPFAIKSIALFIFVRSVFMILTHIAPPLNGSSIGTDEFINKLSSGDDLFFSAHTGLPFLFALIFWDESYLRYFFISATVIGAVTVILGHLHYSIDVFSALFIAFGIFHIAKVLFRKDYEVMKLENRRAADLIYCAVAIRDRLSVV